MSQSHPLLTRITPRFASHTATRSQFRIFVTFGVLAAALLWTLHQYWHKTLQPRMYLVAQTQAEILALSQGDRLVSMLINTPTEQLHTRLTNHLHELLLAEDPAIGDRYIRRVNLFIDYSNIPAPEQSLDMQGGEDDCTDCFYQEVLLTSPTGAILGMVVFDISNGYYTTIIAEMQRRLFTEGAVIIAIVLLIWLSVSVMFHQLHHVKRKFQESDQAKSRFMANVTHELRTPLNAILGFAQLFRNDEKFLAEHQRGITAIESSAEHLLSLINDILEFSRADQEHLELQPSAINLSEFLASLVDMNRVRAQAKGLQFSVHFPPELPTLVSADAKRLRQVLINLIANAIKFTPHGEVTLCVTTVASKQLNRITLNFAVRDTGIGIPKHELGKIFIAYHQVDNKTTRAEGTGLGLTICQRLLKLMGSGLHVTSRVGHGSEFTFELTLPVIDTSPQLLAQEAEEVRVQGEWPPSDWLTPFREAISRHNIKEARQLLEALEETGNHSDFVAQVQVYLSQYRFKPLQQWLAENAPNSPAQNSAA